MGFLRQSVFLLAVFVLHVSCTAPATTTVPSTSSEADKSKQVDKQTSEIVNNDKTREVYVKCLLDKGPCNNDAADVKRLLPDAVQKGCGKCSEMHKKIIEKMMLHLQQKQPDILKQVSAKFDPKGEFMKTFLEKLKKDASNQSNESGQKSGEKGQLPQPGQAGQMSQGGQNQKPNPIRN